MIIPEDHTLLNGSLLIALLIPIFILVPTSAYASGMGGLIVIIAVPYITLTAIFIKFIFLIIRHHAPLFLLGNLLVSFIWESILLFGIVMVIAPTNLSPDVDLSFLVRVILWTILFVVCTFYPNWLLIREDEPITLSSRKNIKVLLLCLATPAIILFIFLYFYITIKLIP